MHLCEIVQQFLHHTWDVSKYGTKSQSFENVSTGKNRLESLCASNGATSFEQSTDIEGNARLWKARHNAYYAALALRKGARVGFYDYNVCISLYALSV